MRNSPFEKSTNLMGMVIYECGNQNCYTHKKFVFYDEMLMSLF